jgi:hypothetical protein
VKKTKRILLLIVLLWGWLESVNRFVNVMSYTRDQNDLLWEDLYAR